MVTRLFRTTRRRWAAAAAGVLAVLVLAGYSARGELPAASAYGADVLRGIIGDQAVAVLEAYVYRAQDSLHQVAYHLGAAQPAAPWTGPTPIVLAVITATPPVAASAPTPASAAVTTVQAQPAPTPLPAAEPAPDVLASWPPAPLAALGALPGVGQWSPYLLSAAGQPIALRTFLQPDPQRPYAVVAIVAFNLRLARLHFVLGSIEPVSSVPVARPGRIPAADSLPGVLLATFNGGFKARHGQFGAMVDGVTVLPPRPGFGTVALYADGRVRIGAWGTSLTPSADMLAWRQNGPLIIQDGQVNPHTLDTAPQDWGYSLDGSSVVWRSGLGLSPDGQTLYYVAGPHLTMPALASALAATGAAQAMQLDINNFWVHFDAIQAVNGTLQASPLLDGMSSGVGRYLQTYPRDFFYITANAN